MINVKEKFLEETADYEKKLCANKWFFSDLRDHIIKHITPEQAHFAVNDLADTLVTEQDTYLYHELLLLIKDLSHHAETAQMPKNLEEDWHTIQEKSSKLNKPIITITKDIARWYRIHV